MNTILVETNETSDQTEVVVDVYQKLLNDRILFLSGDVDDDLTADICATLLLKDAEDSDSKITLFINSRGGDIRNTLAIYDVMNTLKSPLETVCIGCAMREAIIILAAGNPGMRYATKHSVLCAGQLVNSWMQKTDLTNAQSLLVNSLSDNKKMMDIIAKRTNKTLKQVMSDFERLVFMDSQQAKKYGFIDKVVNICK